MTRALAIGLAAGWLLLGCGDAAGGRGVWGADGTSTESDSAPSNGDVVGSDGVGSDGVGSDGGATAAGEVPPTTTAEILAWLEAGTYSAWQAETAVHPSAGPHGTVRTFVNASLAASLSAGNASHPVGAVAVKELYKGAAVTGWAVSVKVQADSAGGQGWYWYEIVGAKLYADGKGAASCTGCHAGGKDYVQVPYPLK